MGGWLAGDSARNFSHSWWVAQLCFHWWRRDSSPGWWDLFPLLKPGRRQQPLGARILVPWLEVQIIPYNYSRAFRINDLSHLFIKYSLYYAYYVGYNVAMYKDRRQHETQYPLHWRMAASFLQENACGGSFSGIVLVITCIYKFLFILNQHTFLCWFPKCNLFLAVVFEL